MSLRDNSITRTRVTAAEASSANVSHTFIELFAGIGLVRLGLEKSGWRCLYANDIDPGKKLIYKDNFPVHDFHLGDVWKIDPKTLPRADLITASFPCTNLSMAGKRDGLRGKHSSTFWALIRILRKLSALGRAPKMVLVENVEGFITLNGGQDFLEAIGELNRCGYATDAVVVDAKHFVPQGRPRLFIIGVRETAGLVKVARNSKERDAWKTQLKASSRELRPQRLVDLMVARPRKKWCLLPFGALPTRKADLHNILEEFRCPGPKWWKQVPARRLYKQISKDHKRLLRELKKKSTLTYGTIYRRMRNGTTRAEVRLDGVAGCLRTPVGGSSRQIIVRAGRGKVLFRWMTPREYARLQGVADSFKIETDMTTALYGFGDAVCVDVIDWIAQNAINPILQNGRLQKKQEKPIPRAVDVRALIRQPFVATL